MVAGLEVPPPLQLKTLPSAAGVAVKLMLEMVREVFRNIRVTVKLIPSTINIIFASFCSLKSTIRVIPIDHSNTLASLLQLEVAVSPEHTSPGGVKSLVAAITTNRTLSYTLHHHQ